MKPAFAALLRAITVALIAVAAEAQTTNPIPKACVSPIYPEELVDTGISGMALIAMTIAVDGTVSDPTLVTADHSAFGTAALAVVRDWKFEPARRDGVAVAIKVHQPFSFQAPFDQQINALFKRKIYVPIAGAVLSEKDFGTSLVAKRPVKPVYPAGYPTLLGPETVDVRFVVDPEGRPINPKIPAGIRPALVTAAIAAVANAAYEPPMKDGQGVYVETTLSLVFSPWSNRHSDGSGAGDFDGEPATSGLDYSNSRIRSQLQRLIQP